MKSLRIIGITLLVLGVASPAWSQVVTRRTLTLDGARQVIAAARAEAQAKDAPGGVIAVVDDGGHLIALERLDGTFAAGATISIGKARTAVLFKRPTAVFEEIIKNGRTPMVALPDALFTPLQGGVPIVVDGEIVGGVGVSGAASAQQDEELAIAGATALGSLTTAASTTGEVTYIGRDIVSAAFRRGAVLLDNGRYMVHASHRDGAGMAEVHTLDTDIIHVLKGEATFVTGGKVVDGTTTEPNEIRGTAIENGSTRQLVPGDVVVVPNGTPHWFQNVSGPFDYYVVKVR